MYPFSTRLIHALRPETTKQMAAADRRITEITRILTRQSKSSANSDSESDDDDLEDRDGLQAELDELRKANVARQSKLDEYEKNKKWNVDNICHIVEERTIVNKKVDPKFNSETGYALGDDDEDEDKCTSSTPKSFGGAKDKKEATTSTTATAKKMDKLSVEGQQRQKKENESDSFKSSSAATTPTDDNEAGKVSVPSEGDKKKKTPAGPSREKIAMMSYHEFTEKYADVCEEFMKLHDLNKTRDFLIQNGHILLQENASNYLLLATLEDEMNGYHDKMRLTARQSQVISNIAELAKSLQSHPGNVIGPFFKRLEDKEMMSGFLDGVETFIKNIEKRAVTKRKEIDAERAKEAKEMLERGDAVDLHEVPKEERLGPGGLDPVEVFESLPVAMQEAFESREIDKLKEALMQMPPEEAELHMKRCVDSGLWNEG